MKVLYRVLVTLILTAPCFLLDSNAQGWEYQNPIGLNFNLANDLILTQDGGYILAGTSTDIGPVSGSDGMLLKLDAEGELQWSKALHPFGTFFNRLNAIDNTTDGGFVVAGSTEMDFSQNLGDYLLARYDSNGDTIWTKIHANPGFEEARDIQETPDGGFILTGTWTEVTTPGIPLIKTDATGNVLWEKYFNFNGFAMEANALDQTDDGGYVLAGTRSGVLYVIKTDAVGDTLWTKLIPGGEGDAFYDVRQTTDGGYILAGAISGFAGESPVAAKLDATGNVEWFTFSEFNIGLGRATSVRQTADGNYIVTGSGSPNPTIGAEGFLTKLDASGMAIWSVTLNEFVNAAGNVVEQTTDGGYIVGGMANNWTYAVKTDDTGNAFSVYLQGNVYHDPDLECDTDDAPFTGLEHWIVEAAGTGGTFYGYTDPNGDYEFVIDTGTYSVNAIPPNNLWSVCNGPQMITMPTFYDTTTVDLFLEADFICPVMSVDISTPLLRRCLTNNYYVTACNHGTTTAPGATVDVTFDPFLTVNSSTIPISGQDGNTYTFDLGNVAMGECVNFSVNTTVSCNAELGQTHCAEAHVFPDSICVVDPAWDMSSIMLEAVCEFDSVRFFIRNIGDGNMSSTLNYLVIEDQIILFTDMFMLDAGTELSFAVPANGSTWRLESDQSPSHPGLSMPSVTVEGCASGIAGPFSTGFVIQYPEDDLNPFIAIDCQENVGSYDPNDKMGFPKGYGSEHYITDETVLDYKIRFQNTGTDTAFTVVVRDTISAFLDIATLQPGVSSAPYELSIHGNVLKFRFDNIMLPDSNINEPASHGFVNFKIAQKAANPNGTIINNKAGIVFDFNVPEFTNTTIHKIGEDFIEEVVVSVGEVIEEGVEVNIAPNPFSDQTIISLEGKRLDHLQFLLFDGMGRLVKRSVINDQSAFLLQREQLSGGLYLFRIEAEGRLIVAGKLIIQ